MDGMKNKYNMFTQDNNGGEEKIETHKSLDRFDPTKASKLIEDFIKAAEKDDSSSNRTLHFF
jgi:hypothetical protein